MIDEDKLAQDAHRAARAKSLLENELLQEAFASLKAQYSADLMATTVDQQGARERLYLAHRIVGEVERHLGTIVQDGKLAARQLKDLAEAAERKMAWHQI